MLRALAISIAVPALVVIPAIPAAASGGGGCGGEVTEAAGTSIDISEYCFVPTVLYVSPGSEVTWTNQDPDRHDVLGAAAAWGSFEWLRQDGTVSHAFEKPGVYPYVCTWHPGMSGAVVVGDGGLERLDIAAISRVSASGGQPPDPRDASTAGSIALVSGLGLFGLLLAGVLRRKGRSSTGS
jgi:plastocyanin